MTPIELLAQLPSDLADQLERLDDEDGVMLACELFDDLMHAGSFELCDALFGVDVTRLRTIHALAIVSITSPARHELACRADFVARVRARLAGLEPDRVDELLSGIE